MTDISELIRKQAAAIKGKSTNQAAAEHLRKAADLLDGGAKKKITFESMGLPTAKSKAAKVEKFAKALRDGKQKEVHQLLSAAGWTRGANDPAKGTATYTHKSLPGHLIKVDGNQFEHTYGTEVKQPKTDTRMLKPYLDKLAGPKTNSNGTL